MTAHHNSPRNRIISRDALRFSLLSMGVLVLLAAAVTVSIDAHPFAHYGVAFAGILLATLLAVFVIWRRITGHRTHPGERDGIGLSAAIEQAGEAILITDPAGEILYVNPAFTAMSGYRSEEVIGRNPRLLKSSRQDLTFYKDLWDTIRGGRIWHGELINRRKDGTLYREEMTIAPVRDPQGKIVRYIAFKQDITERRAAQEARDFLASIVSSSNEAIIGASLDGIIVSWNHGAEQIYGYRPDEIIGRHISHLAPPARCEEMSRLLEGVKAGHRICHLETVRQTKDGRTIDVSVTISPVRNAEGKVIGAASIARDITESNRAEAEMAERHRLATMLVEVGKSLTQAHTLRQGLQECTEILVRHLDAAFARVWTLNQAQQMLELEASAGVYTHIDGAHSRVPVGQFKTGRIVTECCPHITNNVADDSWIGDPEWARREGMVAFAGHPLMIGDRVHGFLAAFARHPLTPAALQAFASVSDSLAQFIERKRSEEDLQRAHEEGQRYLAQLEAVLDNIREGLLVTGLDGAIVYCNAAAADILGCLSVERRPRQLPDFSETFELSTPEGQVLPGEEWPLARILRGESLRGLELYVHRVETDWRGVFSFGGTLARKPDGEPLLAVITVTDITERKQVEQTLREREERFHTAFDHAPFGMCLTSLDGRLLQVNATLCHMLGYSQEELVGRRWADITHPEDMTVSGDAVERAVRGQQCIEMEKRYIHRDGTVVWVQVKASLVRGSDQAPSHFITHIEDITERRRVQEAIRRSEERYRRLVDNLPDLAWTADIQGNTIYISPKLEAVYGYRPEELYQNGAEVWLGRILPSDLPRVIEAFEALFHENKPFDVEYQIQRKDGQWIWVHDRAMRTFTQDGVVYADGVFRDITAQKQAEVELRKAKEAAEAASLAKSRFLANMSHEIRTPMNGVIGMARLLLSTELSSEQRRYAEIMCSSGETLMALIDHVLDLSKIEAGKLVLDSVDFNLKTVLEGVMETLGIQAAAKPLELTCLVAPGTPSLLRGDPGRLRQVVTNLAANAIKFTERGEVAIRVGLSAEDERTATLHFTILDTGIGIPEPQAAKLFSPFAQADASTTRRFGGTGLGLAISKQLVEMMGGRIGLMSEPNKGSTFWFTVILEKQEKQLTGADGTTTSLPEVKVLVVDDHAANRLVVTSLARSWGCRATPAADAGEALALLRQAAADGAGFQLALLDKTMPVTDGEELARQIAADPQLQDIALVMMTNLGDENESLRGRRPEIAGFVSKPIIETRLREALELALGRREAPASRASDVAPPAEQARVPARILLAEDNVTNQLVMVAMLNQLGYQADVVSNGAEAVKASQAAAYDLIFMDCAMPEIDGYEATRMIRASETQTSHARVPIVAVTGHALPGDRERCLREGMDDYLSKPIDPQKLSRVLAKWLRRDHASDAVAKPAPVTTPEPEVVFDENRLLQRMMGDKKLVATIIAAFLDDTPVQLARLQERLAAADAPGVRRQAHTIKGAAANVSAGALRAVALEAEHAATAGKLESVNELLPRLESEFERLRAALARDPR